MLLKLDFASSLPIYMQVRNGIVMGIGRGELKSGDALPTVRQLAQDTGVNAMTINKAYALLKSEGFLLIDRRHGAKVSEHIPKDADMHQKLTDELSLVISEAGLKGIERDEFMHICARVFEQMKGLQQAQPAY